MNAEEICRLAPVIPVLTIRDARLAAPLARALSAGGLRALEVTLRTPAALEAIRAMAAAAPDAVVGAGTLTRPDQVAQAVEAGARFGVSPGATPALMEAARAAGLPLLPGVATPSEAMAAMERGFTTLKFFPAEVNGGVAALSAWAAPLAGLKFCPTGGITRANARDYLALSNVLCVGGSWVAPADLVAAEDWRAITRLAAEAAALRPAAA
ncbi:MAG: ketohydroxyglutarate aldolase [Paracoccaceae bacterium]|nr:MAG: bifunctional 4-hydroxy-2-oxoglutarate aldolase/2-dehydro-3-deoxy-phosphogluconate aldolase [Alphaproteobacteria bacterium]GIX13194.1 MAG: ketohydroxyglutarate aldolase [Paracoccaceae bacterium]